MSWATLIEAKFIQGAKPQADMKIRHTTVVDLFQRYASEVSPTKRGERWETIRLDLLSRSFEQFAKPLQNFTPQDMGDWRDARLKVVSGSSVNRELNLISAVFTTAIKEWQLPLRANPVHLIRRPKSARPRKRRVASDEVVTMCKALGWDMLSAPELSKHYIAWSFAFAVETAMRRGEILRIHWRDVHAADCFIHLPTTKNDEERNVPLSVRALELLALLPAGSPNDGLVPVNASSFDTMFRDAKKKVGLADLHFHDSRREAATRMSKLLPNVLELSAVTGHKTLKMLQIYYEPKATDLAAKLG